jgi:hypothetical protein
MCLAAVPSIKRFRRSVLGVRITKFLGVRTTKSTSFVAASAAVIGALAAVVEGDASHI